MMLSWMEAASAASCTSSSVALGRPYLQLTTPISQKMQLEMSKFNTHMLLHSQHMLSSYHTILHQPRGCLMEHDSNCCPEVLCIVVKDHWQHCTHKLLALSRYYDQIQIRHRHLHGWRACAPDIVQDAIVEEDSVLGHDGHVGTQGCLRDLADVLPIHPDRPRCRIVEPEQQPQCA